MKRRFFYSIIIIGGLWISCSEKQKPVYKEESQDYKNGEAFFDTNVDSAFFYFNKVTLNASDTLEIAMAYSYLSILLTDAGDYYGSQENLLASLKLLDEKKEEHRGTLLSDFNELGTTNLKLGNYESALYYFDQALKYVNDQDFKNTVLNNKALVFEKLGNYNNAINIYQSLIAQQIKNTKTYARILCNYAIVKWKEDSSYNAAPELQASLHIREKLEDKWGINSSLSHLSEFYSNTHPDSALLYANKMYTIAQQLKSPENELEALHKLIHLRASVQNQHYFDRYFSLSDSLQASRNSAKNQFALIKYETAKMKVDKLALEKDNSDKKIQIVILSLLSTLIIGISVIGFILYRKRKQKIFHQQQLKTAQKVHDKVANNIYRIISELEHKNTIEKDYLLEQLDTVYERSRNISHEIADPTSTDFSETLQSMLTSFSSATTAVLLVGNSNDIWKNITTKVQNELQNILQELMVNMKKHSTASNVIIKFEILKSQLQITYKDDGIGLPQQIKYGKGIRNTENRIKNIGGKIIFENSKNQGLKILLFAPIDIAK
ncbi:tetratricopeptide repeat-containing sensor histidine kinase [Rhizosphaericola mali]|uniref:histidine kinase n=1 Tax=Rhizosphaericola mali TaxID=2545455 RepID=A0A5P2G3R7_9BACT|nr:tetratricopeptide repeat-containing sensor histidine kinase [Rhizosphaericola mali]QES89847.1 tetratricopeptide repeat protein [Rhizosphaericola mali]